MTELKIGSLIEVDHWFGTTNKPKDQDTFMGTMIIVDETDDLAYKQKRTHVFCIESQNFGWVPSHAIQAWLERKELRILS